MNLLGGGMFIFKAELCINNFFWSLGKRSDSAENFFK